MIAPGTPLPWYASPYKHSIGITTKPGGGYADRVGDLTCWDAPANGQPSRADMAANAAYILEACNAYPDLLADRDLWKQSEETCNRQYNKLVEQAEALATALMAIINSGHAISQPLRWEAEAAIAAYRSAKP